MQELSKRLLSRYSRQQIMELINLISPQAPTGKMTAAEFAQIQERMTQKKNSYSATSIAIARLYLVEGASTGEAARECGVSYQCAHAVIRRIKENILPSGTF